MTPRDFVYWLQGFLELAESAELTPKQVAMIKRHMALVLTNVTDEKELSTEDEYVKPSTPEQTLRGTGQVSCDPFGPDRCTPTQPSDIEVPKRDMESILEDLRKKKLATFGYRTTCSTGCSGVRLC